MNVIFTCGGTGGHINPAIAIANALRERCPDCNILFIGGEGNMEEELVPKAGYELIALPAHGMARGKSFAAVKHNILAVKTVFRAVHACKKIIRQFKPDVIVGTGGYASFPALTAGAKMKIPTCVHESNAMPGLTTRMVAERADRVWVCFPESAKHYRHPEKVEVVGMPVHRDFIFTQKEAARRELRLDERPVIVSAFGSQGARAMNEAVGKLFRLEKDAGYPFQHIHAMGSYGTQWFPEYVAQQGVDLKEGKGIDVRQYIYNMPQVMAAADIIISRAGASSCNEIAASGTPCILIPSPNVTDNHQEKNARALSENGAAVLVLESECTPQRLMQEVNALLSDKARYEQMRKALLKMSVPDCAERLCDAIVELARIKA